MTEKSFEEALRNIKLPCGKKLGDGKTYLAEDDDLHDLPDTNGAFANFDRLLVLSDGDENVTGGILFYGSADIQAYMLPEYRGDGLMSQIHHNGILNSCLYPGQKVTIEPLAIKNLRDLQMKEHLLSLIGVTASNKEQLDEYRKILEEQDASFEGRLDNKLYEMGVLYCYSDSDIRDAMEDMARDTIRELEEKKKECEDLLVAEGIRIAIEVATKNLGKIRF